MLELSQSSRSIVSRPIAGATLPVVGEHIQAIAERLHQHRFAGHPPLLDTPWQADVA